MDIGISTSNVKVTNCDYRIFTDEGLKYLIILNVSFNQILLQLTCSVELYYKLFFITFLEKENRHLLQNHLKWQPSAVADPGFPVGGAPSRWWRGRQPLTWVLFGKNVCENERIGSCWGGYVLAAPPRSANGVRCS